MEIDRLVLKDVSAEDVSLTRANDSNELIIQIIPTGETISVTNQHYSATSRYGLEEIEFVDGTVWTLNDILVHTVVNGTAANETLYGKNQVDNIFGFAGNDTLYGYDGDDQLVGGKGQDYIDGGAGSDRYVWSKGDGDDQIYDSTTSLSELDTLVLKDVSSDDVTLARAPGSADLTVMVVSTGEVITVTNRFLNREQGHGIESIQFADGVNWQLDGVLAATKVKGDANANTLYGKNYSENMFGLVGNDTLYGYVGNDTLVGGLGADYLDGGGGNDRYEWSKGDGNDQIYDSATTNTQIDTLYGTGYSDNIFGFAGNDSIYGFDDDGRIVGGTGSDYLEGSYGNDRYEWTMGDGNDQIYDSSSNLSEVDSLVLTDAAATDVDLTQLGNDLVVTITPTGEVITVTSRFYSEGSGYGIEIIAFDDGVVTEVLDSSVATTITTGTAANNTLNGWGFMDTFYGLDGNDTIRGYGGTDTLIGGLGQDYLEGGNDADIYIWQHLDGNDTIYDTSVSKTDRDRLVLSDVNPDDVSLFRDGVSTEETVTQNIYVNTGESGYWTTQTVTVTHDPDDPYDLLIKIASTNETITVANQFLNADQGFGIEAIEFADGTIWEHNDIVARTELDAGAADEILNGTDYADNLVAKGVMIGFTGLMAMTY